MFPVQRPLCVIVGVLFAGVASISAAADKVGTPVAPLSKAERVENFRRDYRAKAPHAGYRLQVFGWTQAVATADELERVPNLVAPALARLVAEIRSVDARMRSSRRLDVQAIRRVIANNPDFWRASLEVDAEDATFLILHEALLIGGGELWKAQRMVSIANQLQILPAEQEDRHLKVSTAMMHYMRNESRLAHDTVLDPKHTALRIAELRELRSFAAGNAELLDAQMFAEFWDSVGGPDGVRGVGHEAFADGRARYVREKAMDIAVLAQLDPVAGGCWQTLQNDPTLAEAQHKLWWSLGKRNVVLDREQIIKQIAWLERVSAHELAWQMQRMLIARRGFYTQDDAIVFRRLLRHLVRPEHAAEIIVALDAGDIRPVRVTPLSKEAAASSWRGHPLTHPLLVQQIQREVSRLTIALRAKGLSKAQEGRLFFERGLEHLKSHNVDDAREDFARALVLVGKWPDLSLNLARLHTIAGEAGEAEELFRELDATDQMKSLVVVDKAKLYLTQGRYRDAQAAFCAAFDNRPTQPFYAIFADLAARRAGDREAGRINKARAFAEDGTWPAVLLDFLSGLASENEVFDRAGQGTEIEIPQQYCEANYLFAQLALARGDVSTGCDLLEKCLKTGICNYSEFGAALIELRRLDPARERSLRHSADPATTDDPAAPLRRPKRREAEPGAPSGGGLPS